MPVDKAKLPQSSLAGSIMQQKIWRLTVGALIEANNILKSLKAVNSKITSPALENSTDVQITVFSDVSFNINSGKVYGNTVFITEIQVYQEGQTDMFYLPDWESLKKIRVTYSSYGTEIMAAAKADDRRLYIRSILADPVPSFHLDHMI